MPESHAGGSTRAWSWWIGPFALALFAIVALLAVSSQFSASAQPDAACEENREPAAQEQQVSADQGRDEEDCESDSGTPAPAPPAGGGGSEGQQDAPPAGSAPAAQPEPQVEPQPAPAPTPPPASTDAAGGDEPAQPPARTRRRRRAESNAQRLAERHRTQARRRAAERRLAERRRRAQRLRAARAKKRADERRRKREGEARFIRRPLPDPLPPAKRLDAGFADYLLAESRRQRVSWSLVLGALRAQGGLESVPASRTAVRRMARRLADLGARTDPGRALAALSGGTPLTGPALPVLPLLENSFAERALALARYSRAVGLGALVHGLDARKDVLERRVLRSKRLAIYGGGRRDIEAGRIDVRVLALLLYVALQERDATVSSLFTGHSFYTASGNVSAHSYGRAVDISAVDGTSIIGNQGPGGVTERAVRNILLLPPELQPRQLISLFEFGGPSFAMADHHDHIHVGY